MAATPFLIAATVASGALSAVGALAGARRQEQAADFNAAVARNNAIAARQGADIRERQVRRRYQRLLNSYGAKAAASGVTPEGSPLQIEMEAAALGEQEALIERYKGELQAQGFQVEAEQQESRADFFGTIGPIQAGTTLLTSGIQAAGIAALGRTPAQTRTTTTES